jgi:photoactive yellow protein
LSAVAEVGGFGSRATLDAVELDQMSDAALDELSYGVICLDADGTILRYNDAEARLARLDRANVVGRQFFSEIAPCTDMPEFHGRFDDFVAGRSSEPVVRFEFVFDFKHGSQVVDVELCGGMDGRYYLLINRKAFGAVREGPEAREPAPAQSDLVPVEHDVGVLRNTRQQRVVRTPLLLFEALLRTCDRVAPKTWQVFCREWGVQWGRRAVVDLETECLEETQQSLRERPMKEVAERLCGYLEEQGWGALSVDLSTASAGGVVVDLERSALVAATRREGDRRCHLLAGMLGAAFSHLASRRLHVEEIQCAAAGHPRCRFLVVGVTRRDTVKALAEQGADVETILGSLELDERGSRDA